MMTVEEMFAKHLMSQRFAMWILLRFPDRP